MSTGVEHEPAEQVGDRLPPHSEVDADAADTQRLRPRLPTGRYEILARASDPAFAWRRAQRSVEELVGAKNVDSLLVKDTRSP
jgi:hypothetical protein